MDMWFVGDEVLQWNGKLLPGATMKEVYNIILESQAEPQVELVVSRPIGWVSNKTQSLLHYQIRIIQEQMDVMRKKKKSQVFVPT